MPNTYAGSLAYDNVPRQSAYIGLSPYIVSPFIVSDRHGNIYLPSSFYFGTVIVVIRRTSGLWNGYDVQADYVYRYAGSEQYGTTDNDLTAEDAVNANIGIVTAMAFDLEDNLFFVVSGASGSRILKVNGYHGAMTIYYGDGSHTCPVNAAKSMSSSNGIAIDSSNTVYFTQPGCYRIMRIDPETKRSYVYAGTTAGSGQPTSSGTTLAILTKIGYAYSIAVDDDDNVYFNDNVGFINVVRKANQVIYLLAATTAGMCTGSCENFVVIPNVDILNSLAVDTNRNLFYGRYSITGILLAKPTSRPTTHPTSAPSFRPTSSPSTDNTINIANLTLYQSTTSKENNSMTVTIIIIVVVCGCAVNLVAMGISCYLFVYVKGLLFSFGKKSFPGNDRGEEAEAMLPNENVVANDEHRHDSLGSYPIDQIYPNEDATAPINPEIGPVDDSGPPSVDSNASSSLGNQEFGIRRKHVIGGDVIVQEAV
jgi:hypothetical protein